MPLPELHGAGNFPLDWSSLHKVRFVDLPSLVRVSLLSSSPYHDSPLPDLPLLFPHTFSRRPAPPSSTPSTPAPGRKSWSWTAASLPTSIISWTSPTSRSMG